MAMIAFAAAGGCQDPAWRERTQERRESVHKHVIAYSEHEKEGAERIDRSLKNAMKVHEYHKDHLARTSRRVEEKFARDVQAWKDDQPKREAYLRWQWKGHREKIPATWAKMVY